jgi:calcium-dependent protein kinase
MLYKIPETRPDIDKVLQHEWFTMMRAQQDNIKTNKKDKIERLIRFQRENRLKHLLLSFIAMKVALNEQEEIFTNIFNEFDQDFSGCLMKDELCKGLKKYFGEFEANAINERIFDLLDVDKSGTISYGEFISCLMNDKDCLTHERLEKTFKLLDIENSGFLSGEKLFTILGGDLPKWKKLIQKYDKDKDGQITFEEFKKIFNRTD